MYMVFKMIILVVASCVFAALVALIIKIIKDKNKLASNPEVGPQTWAFAKTRHTFHLTEFSRTKSGWYKKNTAQIDMGSMTRLQLEQMLSSWGWQGHIYLRQRSRSDLHGHDVASIYILLSGHMIANLAAVNDALVFYWHRRNNGFVLQGSSSNNLRRFEITSTPVNH